MINLKIKTEILSFSCAFQDHATLLDLEDLMFTVAGLHEMNQGNKEEHLFNFIIKRSKNARSL